MAVAGPLLVLARAAQISVFLSSRPVRVRAPDPAGGCAAKLHSRHTESEVEEEGRACRWQTRYRARSAHGQIRRRTSDRQRCDAG